MKENVKPYILLLPVLIILCSIFVTGLVIGLAQSLGYFPVIGLKDITFKYYIDVFSDSEFLSSLKFSLYISIVSSFIAVILGVLLSYLILQSKNRNYITKILYKLPIIIPHSIAALLIYNLLSNSGIISRFAFKIGLIQNISDFPSLVFDKNGIGIITSYIWKEVPFIAMVVYTVLSNISDRLSEAALNLGANKRQVFFNVLLPLSMPSILSSFLIVFAFSFGAFEVPYLLGATSTKTLAVKAYLEYTSLDLCNRPYTMVINMILTFISLIFVILYSKLFNGVSKYK